MSEPTFREWHGQQWPPEPFSLYLISVAQPVSTVEFLSLLRTTLCVCFLCVRWRVSHCKSFPQTPLPKLISFEHNKHKKLSRRGVATLAAACNIIARCLVPASLHGRMFFKRKYLSFIFWTYNFFNQTRPTVFLNDNLTFKMYWQSTLYSS